MSSAVRLRLFGGACLLGAVLSVGACGDGSASNGEGGTGSTGGSTSHAGSAAGDSNTSGALPSGAGSSAGGGSDNAAGSAGAAGAPVEGCSVSMTNAEQPLLLSQTGCVNMADPSQPAPGLIPYAVRSALWSDGAAKERFLRIPEGAKIHVLDCAVDTAACMPPGLGGNGAEEGHFEMPVGSVLVKNFSIAGKRIETRLFMRRSTSNLSGWVGFSYEWNDAQDDASLLPDNETGKDKAVGDQVWHYPSRAECLQCHARYAGRSLGPSTRQLNADFAYADGTMNQLAKLEALGLFDVTPKALPAYPVPSATEGKLDERARAYLQANCSMCHRPGVGETSLDLRYELSFADTHLCDAAERDAGKVPTYRLTPGKPEDSGVSTRMHADVASTLRMPRIGSNVVDPEGSKLIDDWIGALPSDACPPR